MKVFSGFPAGKLQVTPLPNVFFTDLLLTIDDLAELKLTLHLFWLLAERAKGARSSEGRSRAVHIRASELRADPTLMESLKAVDPKPEQALILALSRATERGTLLRLDIGAAEGGPGDALFFLNSEAGRREFERLARQLPPPEVGFQSEPAGTADRPNIFVLYEQNIGTLTPLISEELKEAEREYPADWIVEALQIAVDNNKRSWSYVRKILERWKDEGRTDRTKKKKPWYGDEYSKFVRR